MPDNPAGFWPRLGARVIDILIFSLVIGFISIPLYGEFLFFTDTSDFKVIDFTGFLYSLFLPLIWNGYTIGKKALGNRIVKKGGGEVDFKTMFLRAIVSSVVYVLTLGIGIIISAFMIGLRDDKRSIHDFIAGTYVTKNSYRKSLPEHYN
ncbi:RDD family protein [Halobacillus sp. A1]|uniref:RDD family protein n=1 Tax=Halobacillus sp. A1 TaxID=2880262 RepID=UPI003531F3DF|nr:RDD family protein [Halobacillus sp. A1]